MLCSNAKVDPGGSISSLIRKRNIKDPRLQHSVLDSLLRRPQFKNFLLHFKQLLLDLLQLDFM